MLGLKEFRKKVRVFADTVCGPHMRSHRVEWDLEAGRLRAVVRCEDCQGIRWDIPLEAAPNPSDGLRIALSKDHCLVEASEVGFYRFVWYNSRDSEAEYSRAGACLRTGSEG